MTATEVVYPTTVEILNQEIDCEGDTPSYYRMLVNKKDFKYITIEPKIYEVDDLCFPPILLSKLPPFPAGNWNYGRISQVAENATTFFAETSRKDFPSITPLWHAKSYDYLSFKIGERLRSNVYVASSPQFMKPIIAKFARFEVIGFLIENVEGRHATISDLPACKAVVRQLHGLGILHRDLNKHNFLISDGGAVLIDFETAERSDDSEAMEAELRGLEEKLLDESGIGGVILGEEEKET
ncbi:alpha-galactosidase a precursor [Hyaloscypha finlandica]|nr:alpha-galactosidase a precursor [Hyaloscypha finlandica]